MSDFFKANGTDLAEYTRLSNAIGARADYVQGGGGNTSVKLGGVHMAIKASGYTLSDIAPESGYAVLDYMPLRDFYTQNDPQALDDVEKQGSAKAKECTLEIEGLAALRPSVEAGFHSILDKFVAHSHSVYANLAACSEEGRDIAAQALDGAGYTWAFVPYTDPGARLTFSIREEMEKVRLQTGQLPNAIILQNHGFIATHDDAQQCMDIHDDANNRIKQFMKAPAFPNVNIREKDGGYISDTPYLQKQLASGNYPAAYFTEQALYPDQLVFLLGTLATEGEAPADGCAIDTATGSVHYNMSASKALVVEQTLCAIVYIVENIKQAGCTLCTMGEAARSFIENWESEKYRKSIAK